MDIGKVVEIGDRKTPTPPLPGARTRPAMTVAGASPSPKLREGLTPAPALASAGPVRPDHLEGDD
jgi:hypothetical protein